MFFCGQIIIMNTKLSVHILGKGRFGTLLESLLQKHFANSIQLIESLIDADVVVPCVPISAFEEVIMSINDKLKPGAIVIDVCSVKMLPVEIMVKHLRQDIEIVATHPIFGPDSAKNGLEELPLVLWPVRISDQKFKVLCEECKKLGLKTIVMSPEEHDKKVAHSQAFAHLIAKVMKIMQLEESSIDTKSFKNLLGVKDTLGNDTEQLFIDMQTKNPFAKIMRENTKRTLEDIEKMLI